MPTFEVLHQHVGHTPSLNKDDRFDSDDEAFDDWDIDRLVAIGAIAPAAPDVDAVVALAGYSDRQIKTLAMNLGVPDVAKLSRTQLVAAITEKQSLGVAEIPPAEVADEGAPEGPAKAADAQK